MGFSFHWSTQLLRLIVTATEMGCPHDLDENWGYPHDLGLISYNLHVYIYTDRAKAGVFPGIQLHFICMDMEHVDFTLCFTVFYAFL